MCLKGEKHHFDDNFLSSLLMVLSSFREQVIGFPAGAVLTTTTIELNYASLFFGQLAFVAKLAAGF